MGRRWFGRYRLLDRLGVGGWAEVWSALDEETGERVAIKRLHPHVASDPDARARLRREASAHAAIEHPSVVRVREIVEAGSEAAIVLDLVDGEPLSERLAREGPPPPAVAVEIVRRVAGGLAAAHAAGIVHRDVKPSNVLVDRAGTAYLTDFGIARNAEAPTLLTGVGSVIGTLRYLAPEVLRGEASTPASDVWALGCLAFELLEGHPPYPGVVPAELVAQEAAAPPRPVAAGTALANLIVRALDPDPSARPKDGEAFVRELEFAAPAAVDAPTVVMPVATAVAPAVAPAAVAPPTAPAVAPAAAAPPTAPAAPPRSIRIPGRAVALAAAGALALAIVAMALGPASPGFVESRMLAVPAATAPSDEDAGAEVIAPPDPGERGRGDGNDNSGRGKGKGGNGGDDGKGDGNDD